MRLLVNGTAIPRTPFVLPPISGCKHFFHIFVQPPLLLGRAFTVAARPGGGTEFMMLYYIRNRVPDLAGGLSRRLFHLRMVAFSVIRVVVGVGFHPGRAGVLSFRVFFPFCNSLKIKHINYW